MYFNLPETDSQRLQETFFSKSPLEPQARQPRRPKKTGLIIFACICAGLSLSYLFLNYDFLFIPRSLLVQPEQEDLLSGSNLASASVIGHEKQLLKRGRSALYLVLSHNQPMGVTIDFRRPQNLSRNSLLLFLRKEQLPLAMDVVVKDTNHYSNALKPAHITLDGFKNTPVLKISLSFDNRLWPKVNLSKIQQIKVTFKKLPSPENQMLSIGSGLRNDMIIIKDITLVKKGAKL